MANRSAKQRERAIIGPIPNVYVYLLALAWRENFAYVPAVIAYCCRGEDFPNAIHDGTAGVDLCVGEILRGGGG